MAKKSMTDFMKRHHHHALVLQGGGALGAYQAGVYEELFNTQFQPDWIVGVSIGAINAALIAGNLHDNRIPRLTEFWHLVSSGMGPMPDHLADQVPNPFFAPFADSALKTPRIAFNQFSALWSAMLGIPGFYRPRVPPAVLQPEGSPEALSIYDTAPLKATLEKLIDFDLINARRVRLSVGTVNVRTGNSEYFDNFQHRIGPEHIMASCALPPAFPPVRIGGESYWDGGIVSNTPLQYVLDAGLPEKMCVFQVDLFSARGELPANLAGVQQRHKDILYSSRTRYNSNMVAEIVNTKKAIRGLLDKLPADLMDDAEVLHLQKVTRVAPIDIVHLIYRQAAYELESKDYEFSRASVLEHWRCGRQDAHDTLVHPEWLKSSGLNDGVTQFDLTRHTRAV
ncbi:MAG: patatin-like phospholipase family protein [Proteobacteria bacterium]|nr:patatin-like phospholipase family protein [Pseudomonadota bacterium]